MDAASVEDPLMGPSYADHTPDPRIIVTPMDSLKMKSLLYKYNLLSDWDHILSGITNGFNVGIKSPPEHTLIFQESYFLPTQPIFHQQLHCRRSSSWPLFSGLSPYQTRATHWSLLHLPYQASLQTEHQQVQNDPGPISPSKQPPKPFHELQYQP
jgi:hypothetical protein